MPDEVGRFVKIIGERFERLIVISEPFIKKGRSHVIVCCDCGTEKIISVNSLKSGNTKSCGCLRRDGFIKRSTRHGQSGSRLYGIWKTMIQRCTNVNSTAYPRYGGRGIIVCESWKDFIHFQTWARSNGYQDDLTIDRLDNDKDYDPQNCRWATYQQQNINRGFFTNNTSGFRGVSKGKKNWESSIKVAGKTIYLGCFTDKIEAARAYNEAAKHYHGEFACLNPV